MDCEWEEAKEAVFLANHRFNVASADNHLEIDAAIYDLCAAELRLRLLLRERRGR